MAQPIQKKKIQPARFFIPGKNGEVDKETYQKYRASQGFSSNKAVGSPTEQQKQEIISKDPGSNLARQEQARANAALLSDSPGTGIGQPPVKPISQPGQPIQTAVASTAPTQQKATADVVSRQEAAQEIVSKDVNTFKNALYDPLASLDEKGKEVLTSSPEGSLRESFNKKIADGISLNREFVKKVTGWSFKKVYRVTGTTVDIESNIENSMNILTTSTGMMQDINNALATQDPNLMTPQRALELYDQLESDIIEAQRAVQQVANVDVDAYAVGGLDDQLKVFERSKLQIRMLKTGRDAQIIAWNGLGGQNEQGV